MKLYLHQFLSRTGAFKSKNELVSSIRKGKVTVGGLAVVNPLYSFDPGKKRVFWKGALLKQVKRKVYIIVNKPEGYLSSRLTVNDLRLGKKSVFELIDNDNRLDAAAKKALFCVGRLDEDTSGLLILTNDGGIGHEITNPKNNIEKTYEAVLQHPLSSSDVSAMEKGVVIKLEENGKVAMYRTKGCRVEVPAGGKTAGIILTEGRKREVRRMLEAVGNRALRLRRVAIGLLRLDDLKIRAGEYLFLGRESVEKAVLAKSL